MSDAILAPAEPWKVRDWNYIAQQLLVHLGTPVLAALITAVSPAGGKAGFFLVWVPLHLVTASLFAKFGRRKKSFGNAAVEVFMAFSLIIFFTFVGSVLWPVISNGVKGFTPSLLNQDATTVDIDAPLNVGGMGHAIAGTLIMVALSTLICVPIGILAALYVTEVRGKLTPFVRFFVQAMSGVPSIVAGLFVYAAFVVSGIIEFSGLAGALALSILMLPTVARTAEEILRLIPDDLRTAALALGGTQWRVVRMVVLPAARAGLVTAGILGIARVVGETAPLLLTAFGSTTFNANPFSGTMSALPMYVFTQMMLGGDNDVARAWVACLILMVLVAVLFTGARLAAARLKK
ncbi:MAG: phosphate transport system permease protein [Actinomycetota bacterium]|jgi:phosphate transport system permease protein